MYSLRNMYQNVEILTNNSDRDAVVGQDINFLKSAEGPFSHDAGHIIIKLMGRLRVFSRPVYLTVLLIMIVYLMINSVVTVHDDNNGGKLNAKDLMQPEPREDLTKKYVQEGNPEIPKPPKKPRVFARKDNTSSYGCDTWFEPTFEGNLDVIKNYPRGNVGQYLTKLGGNQPEQFMTSFPVIVTAANSGFYGVTQGLIKTIHELLIPKYGHIKIIYYDMGLQPQQYEQLTKHCKCEVRKFPFEEFPNHVRKLKTYTWKPIIVKRLLLEYGWVWWMDSSVRFTTNDLDRALDYSRDNSILFFTYGQVFAVAQHTDVQTMEFLHEDRCKFRHFGEIEATFVLFHFDEVTHALVDAWAACALNSECMCPPGTAGKLGCRVGNKQDGRCHRFDQAVLSVLLRRLFHDQNDYPLVDEPFHIHTIKRGNSVNYFPN